MVPGPGWLKKEHGRKEGWPRTRTAHGDTRNRRGEDESDQTDHDTQSGRSNRRGSQAQPPTIEPCGREGLSSLRWGAAGSTWPRVPEWECGESWAATAPGPDRTTARWGATHAVQPEISRPSPVRRGSTEDSATGRKEERDVAGSCAPRSVVRSGSPACPHGSSRVVEGPLGWERRAPLPPPPPPHQQRRRASS